MKCAVHADQDAIGVCHSCGGGVCSQCQQRIGGIIYCLSCLDAGRYQLPKTMRVSEGAVLQVPPGYLTPLTRYVFTIGIFAMAFIVTGFFLFYFSSIIGVPSLMIVNPLRTLAFIIIAVGITLTGLTFYGFYRYYHSLLAMSVSLFSLLSGWPIVLAYLLLMNPLVITYDPWEILAGPLFFLFQFALLFGFISWAITFFTWAVVLLRARLYVPAHSLIIVVSVLYLILFNVIILYHIPNAILLTVSTYYLVYFFLGTDALLFLVFIEPAAVLSAIIFYRIRK
jgi:hypothetical protein